MAVGELPFRDVTKGLCERDPVDDFPERVPERARFAFRCFIYDAPEDGLADFFGSRDRFFEQDFAQMRWPRRLNVRTVVVESIRLEASSAIFLLKQR